MIGQYLANIQLRIKRIELLLGNISQYKEADLKDVREGINDVVGKLHKDNSRKFEKVKKIIEKHSAVIDLLPTQDKITLLHAELEQIGQVSQQLDRIQKLLPALNTDNYPQLRADHQNYKVLKTCSEVEQSMSEKIAVKTRDDEPIQNVRVLHRRAINQLAELNRQMVSNLSAKLQSRLNKKLKDPVS